jgi:hypothetical protein
MEGMALRSLLKLIQDGKTIVVLHVMIHQKITMRVYLRPNVHHAMEEMALRFLMILIQDGRTIIALPVMLSRLQDMKIM